MKAAHYHSISAGKKPFLLFPAAPVWALVFSALVFIAPAEMRGQVVDTAEVRREVDSLIQVCRTLTGQGKYDEALQVIEAAKKKAVEFLGMESAGYASCVFNQGRVFSIMRKYAEAELLYLEAKSIREKVLGKEHPGYASSLNNLALLYQDMGDYEKAEPFYVEALAIRERVLGKEHSDYVSSLNNLASLYKDMGNNEKAEPLYIEAFTIGEKVLGKEHPIYATTLHNLANLYLDMGNYEKADPLYVETLAIREKILGKEHPHYVSSLTNLAALHALRGNHKKAELLFVESLAIQEKVLGRDDPLYATSLHNLASLYRMVGNYEKAELLYFEALAIREKKLGKEHSDYAHSLGNLASLYLDIGNYERAEPFFVESLAIQRKKLGNEHPDYAATLNNLANLYSDIGNYEKAELLYLESKAILEKVYGKEHPNYAQSLNNLANLYSDIGNYEKSESFHIEAFAIREKVLGKLHPDYAQSLNNLATLYHETGNYEKAEPLYIESLVIWEMKLEKDHPHYAQSLNNLANLYSDIGNYEKAESLHIEALAIREKSLSKEHSHYAQSLNNLATLYHATGNYEKAESLHVEALAIREKVLGKEHPEYVESLNNLAFLYWANNKNGTARQFFLKSAEIEKSLLAKGSLHLSEQELFSYRNTFTDRQEGMLSYAQIQPAMSQSCYDHELFFKGFLLNVVSQINNLAMKDSNAAGEYYQLKSYHRRLSASYAKPIIERDSADVVELENKANILEKELARKLAGYEETMRQVRWQNVQQSIHPGEVAIEFIHYRYYTPNPTDSTMYAALMLMPTDTAPRFIPLCEERQLYALLPERKGPIANYLQNLYASPRRDSLASLYQLLWAPLESLLGKHGVKTVYYSPSGLLHRLNLAAIAPDKSDQTLADRYRLIPMGSTRQLVIGSSSFTRRKNEGGSSESERAPTPAFIPSAGKTATIYGGIRYEMDSIAVTQANIAQKAVAQDTTGGLFRYANRADDQRGDNWDYLPGTEKEAIYLHDLLKKRGVNATLRLGYSATEESFKQIGRDVPSPTLLHIGTHGFFFPDPKDTLRHRRTFGDDAPAFKISDHPLIRSGLKLAGSRYAWETKRPMQGMEDGILTAYEVSQMNLSNTELVVLSACETGLGDIKGNEGVYGLQRAFRIAGAKNVLMSLWKVSDEVTEKLLTRFYGNWLERKLPLREAIEEAQSWLRGQEQYSNPYFWAGFVLVGEP